MYSMTFQKLFYQFAPLEEGEPCTNLSRMVIQEGYQGTPSLVMLTQIAADFGQYRLCGNPAEEQRPAPCDDYSRNSAGIAEPELQAPGGKARGEKGYGKELIFCN